MNPLIFFGLPANSPKVLELFSKLNTLRRPELPDDDRYVWHDWVLVRRYGVELGFSEENYHRGEPIPLWGKGALLLTQAYFYTETEDISTWTGALPYGISWNDDRERVRQRLTNISKTLHESNISDVWDAPEYRLTVHYSGTSQLPDKIICQQMPKPLKAPADTKSPISLESIIDYWGGDIGQLPWRQQWGQYLDDDAIEESLEEGVVDLTDSWGVSLHVNADKGACLLRAITFHRNRDSDSVGWSGKLPLGLDFEDSPQTLFKKLRAKPTNQSADDVTGYALWHFETYTLHVLYSLVDNRLLRVKLLSPGIWKSAQE